MGKKTLVTYASRTDFTRQVAEQVGHVLSEHGLPVDITAVKAVTSLHPYQNVVLGTAIRMGRLLPETLKFTRRFRTDLQSLTTAYFVVCLTMKQDTPDNRSKIESAIEPLITVRHPVSVGLFPGGLDYDRLGFLPRFLFSRSNDPNLAPGDFRNLDAIAAWARDLAGTLTGEAGNSHGTHQ